MSRNYEHKGLMGPGGIKCACCRPRMSLSQAKRYSSRVMRRRAKRDACREASEYTEVQS